MKRYLTSPYKNICNLFSGMSVFLQNITFHGVLLDALFDDGNPDWDTVSQLLVEGITNGAVRPLPTTVFNSSHIEAAFRFMAQGKHVGKVLIAVSVAKHD